MLRKTKKQILAGPILILSLLIIAGPGLSPRVLSAKSLSIGNERDIGEKIQSQIRKEFKLIDDPDIAQYINELGKKVLAVAGHQYFDYQFFVINDDDFNAFAAPAGLIFFNSGLIIKMADEDELLGVMAHEIGHISNRHLASSLDKSAKVNLGTVALILAGIALGASGEGDLSGAMVTGAMATSASMNLKFSRENEEEADRLSFDWMIKMNRNPEALLSMLGKMRRISILQTGNTPTYLLTHPDPAQRMGYVSDLLNTYERELPTATGDDFRFQRIRYRIMAAANKSQTLKPRLLKKITAGEDPDLLSRLGVAQIYISEGNYNEGKKYLNEVIKQYPREVILQVDLGYIYLSEGKIEEAITILTEALEIDPDCAYGIFNMAQALDQTNQTEKAIKLYEGLLVATPTFAKTHYYLGRALFKTGQTGLGHYHTGIYSWFEGNITNTRYHLKKALEKLPGDSEYLKKSREMLDKIAKLEKI